MRRLQPLNEAAAHPAQSLAEAASLDLPGWTDQWCGDVWKTICHLRSTRTDLRVFVLDSDYGLGIITRGQLEDCLNFSSEHIEGMSYDDLSRDRQGVSGTVSNTGVAGTSSRAPHLHQPTHVRPHDHIRNDQVDR